MKLTILIIFVFIFISCNLNADKNKPDNLIDKGELISVLIELEIMEAYYEQTHKRPELYRFTLDSASKAVLQERELNEIQLKQTLDYYSTYPDTLFLLYEQTLDSINSMINSNKTD